MSLYCNERYRECEGNFCKNGDFLPATEHNSFTKPFHKILCPEEINLFVYFENLFSICVLAI